MSNSHQPQHNQQQTSSSNTAAGLNGTKAFAPPGTASKELFASIKESEQVSQQQKVQQLADARPPAPPKNNTGLPDSLKSGVETLSGYSLDDVNVHYNSARPAQLQAHAFAQGSDIHVAPGQEKHLAHEAWHVVQQKQGRVQATTQLKDVSINDDKGLENEADVMGAKAMQQTERFTLETVQRKSGEVMEKKPLQRKPLQKRPVRWPVVQGVWAGLRSPTDFMTNEKAKALYAKSLTEPLNAFREMLWFRKGMNDGAYDEIINYLNEVEWTKKTYDAANNAIYKSITEESNISSHTLFDMIENAILGVMAQEKPGKQSADLSAGEDESDHGADVDAPVYPIKLEEVPDVEQFHRTKDEGGLSTLFYVFENLAREYMGDSLPDRQFMLNKYWEWYNSGPKTRNQFEKMLKRNTDTNNGNNSSKEDVDMAMQQKKVVQRARIPDTYSLNGGYDGAAIACAYNNVIYLRDGNGNIDFTADPKKQVAKFNKSPDGKGNAVKVGSVSWKQPQNNGSIIQMGGKLKADRHWGTMARAGKVDLRKASRTQHFAIADRIYPNSRASKWTWHHLSEPYKMVLVDMEVHRKHGHNGGVYLWKNL